MDGRVFLFLNRRKSSNMRIAEKGIMKNINGFLPQAQTGSNFKRQINADVNPHPGQCTSNNVVYKQGIVILNPVVSFKILVITI